MIRNQIGPRSGAETPCDPGECRLSPCGDPLLYPGTPLPGPYFRSCCTSPAPETPSPEVPPSNFKGLPEPRLVSYCQATPCRPTSLEIPPLDRFSWLHEISLPSSLKLPSLESRLNVAYRKPGFPRGQKLAFQRTVRLCRSDACVGPAPSAPRPFTVHVWSWECGALPRDQVPSGYFSQLGFSPCLKTLLLGSERFTCLCILSFL